MIQATMTMKGARNVLRHHWEGKAVGMAVLQQAYEVARVSPDRIRTLPVLLPAERERVNAVLCFNLGRALGRSA